ncbi:hypothetical protein CH371_01645 [Leptospira wolffii]|uniref:Uncharacterized protein n=1 Tax=Leptospira wolffii TaxID=409998 RepID=A0A2M9ZEF9_9LEPT|nr:hypothetical protein CH371_01645 [Leptospira wolffii]
MYIDSIAPVSILCDAYLTPNLEGDILTGSTSNSILLENPFVADRKTFFILLQYCHYSIYETGTFRTFEEFYLPVFRSEIFPARFQVLKKARFKGLLVKSMVKNLLYN